MRRLLFILLTVLVSRFAVGQASCTAATCAAVSCSESDVLFALPSSGNTNSTVTVNIPACSATTWTTELIYTPPTAVTTLNILGSGTPNSGSGTTGASSSCTATDILDDVTTGPLVRFLPTYPQVVEIGCMIVDPVNTSTALYNPIQIVGTCTSSGCPSVRVHNFNFGYNIQWSHDNNSSNASGAILLINVFGVIDHDSACLVSAPCPIGGGGSYAGWELFQTQMGSYLGVGISGDNSWAQPDSFGTANNIFAENNLGYNGGYFPMNDSEQDDGSFNNRGGTRVVMRNNTWHQGMLNTGAGGQQGGYGIYQNHGTDSGGRTRSGREAEIYNNNFYCDGTLACSGVDGGFRGGTGLYFGNQAHFTQATNGPWVSLAVLRNVTSSWNPFSPNCGGFDPWDTNDGGTVSSQYTVSSTGTGTVTVFGTPFTTNQFAPGSNAYFVFDVTAQPTAYTYAAITGNTTNQLTISALAGTISGGDQIIIVGTTLYASGTISTVTGSGTSAITMSVSGTPWTASQWVPSGAPYSITDITNSAGGSGAGAAWGAEIASNTSNGITTVGYAGYGPFGFSTSDHFWITRSSICLDQPSRGQQTSTILSGDAPTPISAVVENLDPIYRWNETAIGGATDGGVVANLNSRLINYRDFYESASGVQTTSSAPFACDGSTGGTGWGTFARRPTSCSGQCSANNPGCGYFATDQGSQGTLYTWQSGAWATYYQPYPYPHWLDAGGTSYLLSLTVNGSGLVTSSPTGISCPGTCSFTYNAATVVTLTETPISGATFTGWSGGGCSGTSTTCSVTMSAAESVTASFTSIIVGPCPQLLLADFKRVHLF
jgi:hypothetical protein